MITCKDYGYVLQGGGLARHAAVQNFLRDGINMKGDYVTVDRCTFIDTAGQNDHAIGDKAHRDAVQLIPVVDGLHRQQYAAAEMVGATIMNCSIFAAGTHLQGIFASDGAFRDLTIVNNHIQTSSQHKISINGLISGFIANNRDSEGNFARIQLDHLRIGGGVNGRNVRILSFCDYQNDYKPLELIIGDRTTDHVIDNRRCITRPQDAYIKNFDLVGYRNAAQEIAHADITELCMALQVLAFQYGDRVNA